MLTARQVPAAEALAIGLVDRLTDGDAAEAALALAGELAGASLPAQRAVVAAVDAASDLPLGTGLGFEAERVQALFEHGEAAEGIAAFTEKRPARFA
jgi:enoyl-CoA hydratase/carnithine racemase